VRASGTERGAAPRVQQRQRQRLGEKQLREEGKTARSSTASEASQSSVDTVRCCSISGSSQSAASQTRCRSAFCPRARETEEEEKDGKGKRGRDGARERERERERERHLARVYARAGWADSSATREQHPPIYNATYSLLLPHLGGRSFGIKPRACCWDGSLPAGL